jgi:hypothetical protein
MLRTYSCKILKKKVAPNFNCIFCKGNGLSMFKMQRTYSCKILKKKVAPNFNCIFCKGNGLSICLKCKGLGKIYENQKEYNCNCCFFGRTICFHCNGTGIIYTPFNL